MEGIGVLGFWGFGGAVLDVEKARTAAAASAAARSAPSAASSAASAAAAIEDAGGRGGIGARELSAGPCRVAGHGGQPMRRWCRQCSAPVCDACLLDGPHQGFDDASHPALPLAAAAQIVGAAIQSELAEPDAQRAEASLSYAAEAQLPVETIASVQRHLLLNGASINAVIDELLQEGSDNIEAAVAAHHEQYQRISDSAAQLLPQFGRLRDLAGARQLRPPSTAPEFAAIRVQ